MLDRVVRKNMSIELATLEKIVGGTAVGLGLLILLAAIIILVRLSGQKNIKFVRFMVIIILMTSFIEIIVGVIILKLVDV